MLKEFSWRTYLSKDLSAKFDFFSLSSLCSSCVTVRYLSHHERVESQYAILLNNPADNLLGGLPC